MNVHVSNRSSSTPVPKLKVALVEDRPGAREKWSQLISSFDDMECVATFASGEEALAVIPDLQPDIVLMDIYMPKMSGIECTARLRPFIPKSSIVILSEAQDEEMVVLALEAGADGYLLKRTKPEVLRTALLDVVSGGAPMTSEIARRVVESFHRHRRTRLNKVRLTAREEEVLVLLSQGYSNKEIADKLFVGIETIRTHLKNVYEKMHVRSRAEAVSRYVSLRGSVPGE